MLIRPAQRNDSAVIWAILEPIIRAGETYAGCHWRLASEQWVHAFHDASAASCRGVSDPA